MKETILDYICRNELKAINFRIAKLEEAEAPQIMIDCCKAEAKKLEEKNLKISGDIELLNVEIESIEQKKGRGGKVYLTINNTINYFPNARYGRYIARKDQ